MLKKSVDKSIPLCYTIIAKREMKPTGQLGWKFAHSSNRASRWKNSKKPLDKLHKVWYNKDTKGESKAVPKGKDPRESVRPVLDEPTARCSHLRDINVNQCRKGWSNSGLCAIQYPPFNWDRESQKGRKENEKWLGLRFRVRRPDPRRLHPAASSVDWLKTAERWIVYRIERPLAGSPARGNFFYLFSKNLLTNAVTCAILKP